MKIFGFKIVNFIFICGFFIKLKQKLDVYVGSYNLELILNNDFEL